MARRPADILTGDPDPGETPPRRNPKTRLLNKARDEAGLYSRSADKGPVMRDSSKSDLEGRTRQLTARIKEGTLQQMHRMAAHEGITLGEFIERAIAAYDENGEG